MHAFIVRLFAISIAIATPLSAQIVGEIRAFAFDPAVEPGKSAYAKLADQGWMECKGQELPYGPNDPYYQKIHQVLGITWGTTSKDQRHPTNFLIPDLRGEFLRAWDHGRKLDPEASSRILPPGHQKNEATDKVGTSQNDKVRGPGVSLTSNIHNTTRGWGGPCAACPIGAGTIVELRDPPDRKEDKIGLESGDHVGRETVPHNVYVFYAIFVGTKVRPEHR